MSLVLHGLERGTDGVTAGGCVGRSNGDLLSGTTGLTIVVYAVLYVAVNALQMVTALLVVHDSYRPFEITGAYPDRNSMVGP